MEKNKKLSLVGFISVVVSIIITAAVSWMLYEHTVNLLTINLKERLLSIVQTGAVQFDYKDLEKLQVEEDWKKPEWSKVVKQLKKIRENNNSILFAYIFRKSHEDPSKLVFVSDSHSIDPYAKIDLNHDGIIDDADQLQWPGQSYDEPPPEALLGFGKPVTNQDLYSDQWGVEITGYAPIKDDKGNPIAVLAVDIKADDFLSITRQTLKPFLAFILGLICVIIMLASSLIKIWTKQVNLVIELDRQKDELLSIVSHQLATPVSAVKWNLEMMLDGDDGKLTDKQQEDVKSLQGITGDLSDLVSMILDVSRIQLGRMKIEKQELDLNVFFKEILEIITPKAQQKKVKFDLSVPKEFPKAMLDKRYTHMTIENLLSNAIKYTPENGTVIFKVEIKNNTLYCEVRDTGVGIPKKDQDKIFGKMFRASNVQNTVDGNGFGLYVAKGSVEAQGGKIWFESEENKGTAFFVELPLS